MDRQSELELLGLPDPVLCRFIQEIVAERQGSVGIGEIAQLLEQRRIVKIGLASGKAYYVRPQRREIAGCLLTLMKAGAER